MKKIIVTVVLSLFLSCEISESNVEQIDFNTNTIKAKDDYGIGRTRIDVITIDSCEYIILSGKSGYGAYGGIVHKHNCKFCKQRKEQEK